MVYAWKWWNILHEMGAQYPQENEHFPPDYRCATLTKLWEKYGWGWLCHGATASLISFVISKVYTFFTSLLRQQGAT